MSAIQRAAIKKPKRQFKPPATELRVGRVPIEKQPTNPNLPPRELSVSSIHTHRRPLILTFFDLALEPVGDIHCTTGFVGFFHLPAATAMQHDATCIALHCCCMHMHQKAIGSHCSRVSRSPCMVTCTNPSAPLSHFTPTLPPPSYLPFTPTGAPA